MCAKSLQSCPTLCDPTDYSLPGCSVHGILQARILEWMAMLSSRGLSWPRGRSCPLYCRQNFFLPFEPLGKPLHKHHTVFPQLCLASALFWVLHVYGRLMPIPGEGDGTPLQYSCLKIPWTQEPGGLQSMGSQRVNTTERLHFHFSLSCTGEGNGNPP